MSTKEKMTKKQEKENRETDKRINQSEWTLVGAIGVDSGSVLVCDPAYLKDVKSLQPDAIRDAISAESEDRGDRLREYLRSGLALRYNSDGSGPGYDDWGFGDAGAGHVLPTWIGDGVYPVYVQTDGDRITELRIDFVEPWEQTMKNRKQKGREMSDQDVMVVSRLERMKNLKKKGERQA